MIGLVLAIGSLVIPESPRFLLDTDQDGEGMRVLADIHGFGDPDNDDAKNEYREIKEGILIDVCDFSVTRRPLMRHLHVDLDPTAQRNAGLRTYLKMWQNYKYRILIAMSAQAFAQLVSLFLCHLRFSYV